MKLKLKTTETAPEASRPFLEQATTSMGFVPNLFATFANAPAVLEGYLGLSGAFAKSSLTPTEQEIVLISASIINGCEYCVAGHTSIGQMRKVDAAVLDALRDEEPLLDPKLEALRRFTRAVVQERGWVSEAEQRAFLAAGYEEAQALEVVLGVTMKTLSNYTNHLAETPLDPVFEPNLWRRAQVA